MQFQLLDQINRLANPAKYRLGHISRTMRPYVVKQIESYANKSPKESRNYIKCSPQLFAYASLALESNLSVLICGEITASAAFLDEIVGFIPKNEPTIAIQSDFQRPNIDGIMNNAQMLYGNGFNYPTAASCIEKSLKMGPKWIVLDKIRKNEASKILKASDFGASFLSTLQDSEPDFLIRRIMSRPFCVHPDNLSSLDIAIYLPSTKHVETVCEFLWLSRAEIAFGTDIAGRDMVKETKVALSDKNSLETSKVIRDYAEMFDAPIDFALNEFEIRVKKSTNP